MCLSIYLNFRNHCTESSVTTDILIFKYITQMLHNIMYYTAVIEYLLMHSKRSFCPEGMLDAKFNEHNES